MANHDPKTFEAAARAIGFQGFGFYPRSGFFHVDLGPARSWGERFPKRATAFAAETPPAREVLADSRTFRGSGAAGVATVGALASRWRSRCWPRRKERCCRWCRTSTRCGGSSSRWRSAASPSRSTPVSTTGSGAGGDRRPPRRRRRQPRAARRIGGRRSPPPPAARLPPLRGAAGTSTGAPRNLGEKQCCSPEDAGAAARRPRDRGELAERLRDGRF